MVAMIGIAGEHEVRPYTKIVDENTAGEHKIRPYTKIADERSSHSNALLPQAMSARIVGLIKDNV